METYKIKTAATASREICVTVSDTFDLVEFLDNEPENLPAGVELLDARIISGNLQKLFRFPGNDDTPAFCFIYECELWLNPNYGEKISYPADYNNRRASSSFDNFNYVDAAYNPFTFSYDKIYTKDFNDVLTALTAE